MERLLAITMQCITANKDSVNAYLGNSYASLQSVMDSLKSPLEEARLAYAFSMSTNESGQSMLVLTVYDVSNIASSREIRSLSIPLSQAKPQELGAQLTYFRRYALCVMFNVIGDDDSDAEVGDKLKTKPELPKRTPTALGTAPKFTI